MSKPKNVQIKKDNVVEAIDKVIVFKNYSIQGSHVILKPTQYLTFEQTFESLLDTFEATGIAKPVDLELKPYILTALSKITERTINTFQVGKEKGNNQTDKQKQLMKDINKMIADNADHFINGKAFYIGSDGVPREGSFTFTCRTPDGRERKEYIDSLQKQIAKVKNESVELTEDNNNK
tara:strand:+ start:82 stop:618 length:537 start_codon:yes stop_codon:yes gene_type:complete